MKLQEQLRKQSLSYKSIFLPFFSTDYFAKIPQQKEKNKSVLKQTTKNIKYTSNFDLSE